MIQAAVNGEPRPCSCAANLAPNAPMHGGANFWSVSDRHLGNFKSLILDLRLCLSENQTTANLLPANPISDLK
jgi:hypothetical protein